MKRFFSIERIIVIGSVVMYLLISTVSIRVKSLGDLDFHREALKFSQCLKEGSCEDVSLSKAPLPSVFYAIPYLVLSPESSKDNYWTIAVIWSGIFITAALILVYRATNTIFNTKKAGQIFIVLSFLIPLHIYYGLGVMAEAPAYIAVSLAIYGWSIFKVNLTRGIVYYSLGIILLIMARPNAALILPIVFLSAAIFWWRKIGEHKVVKALTLSALMCSVLILMLFSLTRKLPGNSKSSQENYFLHVAQHGRFQFRDETWDWRFWDDNVRADSKDYQNSHVVKKQLDSLVKTGHSYDAVYSKWLRDDILSIPMTVLKQFLVRIIYGHTLTINSITQDSFSMGPMKGPVGYYFFIGGINVLNWSMIFLAAYGMYILRDRWSDLLFILIPWLALVVFSAAVYMEQRYLFPIRPVILLFASGGLLSLYQNVRLRFRPNTQN